jgi:hypothetical protein
MIDQATARPSASLTREVGPHRTIEVSPGLLRCVDCAQQGYPEDAWAWRFPCDTEEGAVICESCRRHPARMLVHGFRICGTCVANGGEAR